MDQDWKPARSVFLSDLHLGWRHSKPRLALDYLNRCPPEFLYLVGDTFEWGESPGFTIPKRRPSRIIQEFLQTIDRLKHHGTKITFLAGNHDNHLATCLEFADVHVCSHVLHHTLNQRKYLIVHGDIFDCHDSKAIDWKNRCLGELYPLLLVAGSALSRLGWKPKSMQNHWATLWKLRFERVRVHIERFEQFMIDLARSHLCQGIICGHIHQPVHRKDGQLEYLNCGDWVEHQSLVMETTDGTLRLIRNLDFA